MREWLKRITDVMTLASSMKSSSLMVPSFIILTATSILARHLPRRTTPNWPEPSSSKSVSSDGSISHLSWLNPAVAGIDRSPHGGIFKRHAKPPLLCLHQKFKSQLNSINRMDVHFPLSGAQLTGDSSPTRRWTDNSVSPTRRIPVCCSAWCGNASLAASVYNRFQRKIKKKKDHRQSRFWYLTAILDSRFQERGLHFREQRQGVHPFGGGIADDETSFAVFVLQQVLGALTWHIAHVPTKLNK